MYSEVRLINQPSNICIDYLVDRHCIDSLLQFTVASYIQEPMKLSVSPQYDFSVPRHPDSASVFITPLEAVSRQSSHIMGYISSSTRLSTWRSLAMRYVYDECE